MKKARLLLPLHFIFIIATLLFFTSPNLFGLAQAQARNASEQVRNKLNVKDNLTYIRIPAGKFQMGCSPSDSRCSIYEKPAHSVTISEGFWIGQTPVTQAADKKVIGGNPSHFRADQLPAESVTWDEAQAYCKRVDMRLPSEAEWEYAARGENPSARYGPIESIAWYRSNSSGTTHKVELKRPNRYGLYDILGNVDEWVADLYGPCSDDADALKPSPLDRASGIFPVPTLLEGTSRVVRGASWSNDASLCERFEPYEIRPVGEAPEPGFPLCREVIFARCGSNSIRHMSE